MRHSVAASRIRSWWKGSRTRANIHSLRLRLVARKTAVGRLHAAACLQALFKGYIVRLKCAHIADARERWCAWLFVAVCVCAEGQVTLARVRVTPRIRIANNHIEKLHQVRVGWTLGRGCSSEAAVCALLPGRVAAAAAHASPCGGEVHRAAAHCAAGQGAVARRASGPGPVSLPHSRCHTAQGACAAHACVAVLPQPRRLAAAVQVQATYRGHRARLFYKMHTVQAADAATIIQAMMRGAIVRRKYRVRAHAPAKCLARRAHTNDA